MARALQMVGLPLDGSHHRGLDDARNIAKLVPWALRTTPNLQTQAAMDEADQIVQRRRDKHANT